MRAALLCLVSASLACSDPLLVAPPEAEALYFMLEHGADGTLVREPQGPWLKDEVPKQWAVEPENTLRLLAVDPMALKRAYPSFKDWESNETKLIRAPAELEGCSAEGLLRADERVVVPLESLGDGVKVSALGHEDLGFVPDAALAGFALEFSAGVCNESFGPAMFPLGDENDPGSASMTSGVGPIRTLDHVSPFELVLFGSAGIAIIQGDTFSTSSAVVTTLDTLMASEEGRFRISHGLVAERGARNEPSTLIIATTRLIDGAGEEELGIARLSLTEAGLSVERYEAVGRSAPGGVWIRNMVSDANGRYFGVGLEWILTATSATARPSVTALPRGFNARSILVLSSEPPKHFVVGSRTYYEGNVFDGIPPGPSLPSYSSMDVGEAGGAGFLEWPERRPVLGFDDGRLRVEGPEKQWVEYAFTLPPEAGACGAGRAQCGRSGALESSYLVQSAGDGGLLLAPSYCSAFFYRSPFDSCARAFTLDGYAYGETSQNSIVAATQVGSRVVVVTPTRRMFVLTQIVTDIVP